MATDYENMRYDAFISYRHTSPDMEIAEKLHKLLETTKPPKGYKKIQRVFRDRDELPTSSNLADSILEALKNSRYLIVICSPRTPLSQWVIKEIDTFRELHGNDRILALLIEGEPQDSFPKELLYVNGIAIEPLAADIRAKDLKTMKKKLRGELLRLLAPIYGCNFDDLKQRHKMRKMKQLATVFGFVTVFSLLFGSYSLRQALLLQDKTEKLEKSEVQLVKANDDLVVTNDQLESQNDTLEFQMNEILIGQSKYIAKEALALTQAGDSRTAILIASKGLPSDYENLDRPYVPEAEYALFNAIKPYKIGNDFYGDYYAHHSDGVESMSLSPDGNYILSQSNDDYLYVWDVETQEILYKAKYLEYSNHNGAVFVEDTTEIIYVSETGLQQVDFLTGEVIWNNGLEITAFVTHPGQGLLIGQGSMEVYICDLSSGKLIETKALDLYLRDAAFNESGTRLICKDSENKVIVYNIYKRGESLLVQNIVVETYYDNFISYAISQDGKTIAVSSNDYSDAVGYKVGKGELKIYDLESGNEIVTMASETESYMMLMFNNGNDKMLHWYHESMIHSYDIESGLENPTMAHGEVITKMKGSIDGTLIMASAYDDTIRYFEVETGTEYEFARFNVPAGVDDFTINDDVLVTMDILQEDLMIWRSSEGPSIHRFDYETSIESGFYIGNDYSVTISYNGEVSIWDTKNQKHIKVIKDSYTSVIGNYIEDSNSFLLLDEDGNAGIYDASTFELITESKLDNYSSYTNIISHNKGYIAYVNSEYTAVFVYDRDLNLIQKFPTQDYVSALKFSPNEDYLALHSSDYTMIHSLSGLEKKIKLPASEFVSFSSTSDMIAISTGDNLQLFSKDNPKEIVKDTSFDSAISAICFNPNKEEILIGLVDESLYVYNYMTDVSELIDGDISGRISSIQFISDICLVNSEYGGFQIRDTNSYVQTSHIRGLIDISPSGELILFKDHKSLLQAPILSAKDLIELGKTIVGSRVLTEAEMKTYSINNH